MQNKKAFTLAEILITLAVIGVVASLTISPMIKNIQEKQFKVAWKKSFSTISQASLMMATDNDGSLKYLYSVGQFDQLMRGYTKYLYTVKECGWSCSTKATCWHQNDEWTRLNGDPVGGGDTSVTGTCIILNNGSFITFYTLSYDCTYSTPDHRACFALNIDVNGKKGPNVIGKDIFRARVIDNGQAVPAGGLCDSASSGWGCSLEYLLN